MVLQFADGGNLHNYLKSHSSSLTWPDKFKMAIEITSGLMCLHAEQIVHRDLVKRIKFKIFSITGSNISLTSSNFNSIHHSDSSNLSRSVSLTYCLMTGHNSFF